MQVIKRISCRAILLTPEDEVLLIKISNAKGQWTGWITPGGSLDPGESEIAGLKRELKEELGYVFESQAQKVWNRFHRFPWNDKVIEQHKEMRWWGPKELQHTNEEFAPSQFPQLLNQLVSTGIPAELIDVGV